MSKFKPGALVMLRGNGVVNPFCKPFVGTVQTLGERASNRFPRASPNAWLFDPPLVASDGRAVGWTEPGMKLIDPGEGTDEMLLIAGKPERKVLEVQG